MPFHVVVKRDATIPDTLKLINKAVNVYEHSPFVEQLTKRLNPTGNKYDFIKRLFDWVCENVQYKLDSPGDEEVWSPEKTVREGIGDCKKMTVLIASVLKCAGIEPVLKHVYYDDSPNTHIYVVVPFPDMKRYLTVDPVNHKQWNTEVKHKRASLNFLNGTSMDLHMMGKAPARQRFHARWGKPLVRCVGEIDDDMNFITGIGCPMSGKDEVLANALMGDFGITGLDEDEIMGGMYAVDGMGRRRRKTAAEKKARKEKRKARRKKLFGFFKKGTLAPSRGAFLLLVRSNIFKLANRMAKVWIHDPSRLKNFWKEFGGNPNKLRDAIKKGSRKKPELSSQVRGIAGMDAAPTVADLEAMEMNGTMGSIEGIGSATAIAAAVAAATPLVLAVLKIIGKSKDDQDTSSDVDTAAEGVQEAAQNYADQGTQGIGYMSDQDDIITGPGEDFDYIDGMGRKRKKNKGKRKAKKAAKKEKRKARKEARRAKKGKGADGEGGEAETEERESITSRIKAAVPIHDEDIKTLSTLAEYGTQKILKGQVSMDDIKQFKADDGGTEDTPLAKPKNDEDDKVAIPTTPLTYQSAEKGGTAAAGNFGLSSINTSHDLMHWLKGALVLSMAGAGGFTIITDVIVVGSIVWLTRHHIVSFTRNLFTKKQ